MHQKKTKYSATVQADDRAIARQAKIRRAEEARLEASGNLFDKPEHETYTRGPRFSACPHDVSDWEECSDCLGDDLVKEIGHITKFDD